MRLSGVFFAALSAKKTSGEIELFPKSATIYSKGKTVCRSIGIQSIQNRKDIYLDNGFLFALENPLSDEQERLFYSDVSRGIKWLENFSVFKALLLAITLIFFVFALRYSLNIAVPFAAHIFPLAWEQQIGKNSYETMRKTVFEKSDLPVLQIQRLRKKASDIAKENGFNSPEVLFHKSDIIGANALAFPAGPIVVTDDLVLLLERDDIILSVIAHEFAHIQERHSLQQIIEIVGVAAVASVILGADDTLLEEASAVAVNLWANKKSRDFEKEADLLAQQYMDKAGLGKSAFVQAIEKLTRHYCAKTSVKAVQDCLENTESGWLSTHPSGAERIDYLSHSH